MPYRAASAAMMVAQELRVSALTKAHSRIGVIHYFTQAR